MLIQFVTSNPGKLATAQRHLAPFGVTVKRTDVPLIEPQSTDVTVVARSKAEQAWSQVGAPLIVEDGGLCIDGLRGFPGSLTKHVLEALGPEGIARLADMSPTRQAWFTTCLVYVDAAGELVSFPEFRPPGSVSSTPMGTTPADAWSSLWDVYIPAGHAVPLSAMKPSERTRFDAHWAARSRFTDLGEFLVAHRLASAPERPGELR